MLTSAVGYVGLPSLKFGEMSAEVKLKFCVCLPGMFHTLSHRLTSLLCLILPNNILSGNWF